MEYYETWCQCTYVYSNQTAKIRWLISAFVVLLWGGSHLNSLPQVHHRFSTDQSTCPKQPPPNYQRYYLNTTTHTSSEVSDSASEVSDSASEVSDSASEVQIHHLKFQAHHLKFRFIT